MNVEDSSYGDMKALIPQDKHDLQRAKAAVAAGFPAVAPILAELLIWLQDSNWPVAHILAPFLASVGTPLVPHIEKILETDDEVWKYWIITDIMQRSPEVAQAFRPELERLSCTPTERERDEELNVVATDTLVQYGWL